MKKLKLGIVGASGLVGETLLNVMKERNIIPDKLFLYASKESAGKIVNWNNQKFKIKELTEDFINDDFNVLFFSAGENISKKFAPIGAKKAEIVIDNSSAFRYEKDIPLVVPQVNGSILKNYTGIIANPNCTTIQLVVVLNTLKKFGLKRVIVSTYQAVSGAGRDKLMYLKSQGKKGKGFEKEIVENLIPKIGAFMPDYYFKEEWKIINETKKILDMPSLNVTATCVRVPVVNGHSESVTCEFEKSTEKDEILKALSMEKIIKVYDNDDFITPLEAANTNKVYVSRIRQAFDSEKWWNFFIVSDNLRRGAATNALDILESWRAQNGYQ